MVAPNAVAVVDDDQRQAETVAELLVDAGYSPVLIPQPRRLIATATELAVEVCQSAVAAVCDHRLSPGNLAHFSGAEAVATLYDMKVPALLLTQYSEMDIDVSIRRWRDRIPIVLTRDEADEHSRIRESIDLCARELRGDVALTRRAHRSLVQVSAKTVEGSEDVLDVFVMQWRPHVAVRLPLSCVPTTLRSEIASCEFFIAAVNIEAEKASDLYFRAFEASPRREL